MVDTEGVELTKEKHMMMNPIKHIDQCQTEMKRFFPGRFLSEIRSEVVANETFGTKLYNGIDPFWKKMSDEYTPQREDNADAKVADRFVEIVNQMTMAILWSQYKMIYTLDPDLADALSKTKKLHFTKEIFSQIPYEGFYINLSSLPEYQAEGCLVIVSKNKNSSDMVLLDIQLVGAKDFEEGDGTYEFFVFTSRNGHDGIRNNRTITEGVFWDDANGIFMIDTDEFIEAQVKGKQALLKKTRAGYSINQENPYLFLPIRKRMLSLSLLVIQFLMYISSEKPDIELSKETKRQKNRLKRLNKEESFNEPEKWNVGARYGEKIRLYKKQYDDISDDTEKIEHGHHRPPRPHFRRAHWQYYWTGEGRAIQKHVWVAPTFVNGSNDEIPITIIDVTDKETKGYDGENHIREYLQAKKVKHSATGTGKTYASAFAMRNEKPKKALFIVHRELIARQALKSYKKVFGSTKKLALLSGNSKEYDADILFATMSMMAKTETLERYKVDEFDWICIDEVHRAGSESYQKIMNYFQPDFWLGMTASPERTDGFDIFNLFDHNIAYEIRLQHLNVIYNEAETVKGNDDYGNKKYTD